MTGSERLRESIGGILEVAMDDIIRQINIRLSTVKRRSDGALGIPQRKGPSLSHSWQRMFIIKSSYPIIQHLLSSHQIQSVNALAGVQLDDVLAASDLTYKCTPLLFQASWRALFLILL
jgi:hypothetical protein